MSTKEKSRGARFGAGVLATGVFFGGVLLGGGCSSWASAGASQRAGATPSEEPRRNSRPSETPPDDFEDGDLMVESALLPRVAERLDVAGYSSAVLLVPEGGHSKQKFRVVINAHGAGGRAQDHCSYWDPQLPSDFVLLCLIGTPLARREPEGGAYFPDHFALRNELRAAISALKARSLPQALGQFRFIGYSQGATMGALAIVGEVTEFNELVLIEGGGENWTTRRAAAFKEGGGERVLFACGTKSCAQHARRSALVLEAVGVEVAQADAPGAGHTYGGSVGMAALAKMNEWDTQIEPGARSKP